MGPGGNQMSPKHLQEAIGSRMVQSRSFPAGSEAPGCSVSRAPNVLDGCLHPGTSMEDAGSSGAKTRACNHCPAGVPRELTQE